MALSASRPRTRRKRSSPLKLAGLAIALVLLAACFLASMGLGAADITPGEVWRSLWAFDAGDTNHLIVRTVRLPRSIVAVLVGTAMAMAGAIAQGLTGNPLASPSILGVSTGSAFAVVAATFVFGIGSPSAYAGFALLGGAIATGLVYLFAALGPGGIAPLNLTLAGTVLSTFVATLTSSILILDRQTLEQVRFWLAGSLTGADLDLIPQIMPYLAVGWLLALALGRQVTTLSLGEGIARGLGQNTLWVKGAGAIAVVLLVGGSVSLAGPIGFIGLVVPHLARFLVGVDYRWILPYAGVLGAIVLLVADTLARTLASPLEIPVGLVTPLLGAPFFIYLIRTQIRR